MLVAFSVDCLWISWRSNHLKSAQLNLRRGQRGGGGRVREGSLKDARATDTRDAIECQGSVRCVCECVCNRHSYRFISCHTHTHRHTHTNAHEERHRQTARDAVRSLHSRRCLSSKEGGKLCSLSLPSSPSLSLSPLPSPATATAPPTSSNEAARHLVKYFALN